MKNYVKVSVIKKNRALIAAEMNRIKAGQLASYKPDPIVNDYGVQVTEYGVPVTEYGVPCTSEYEKQIACVD